jgi:predicted nucleic acid-binding protein
MLLPEMLSKPVRDGDGSTVEALAAVLARLDLLPVDAAVARLAVVLAAQYRLRAADSVHLATAVVAGADRFITNNRKDFATTITEIDVVYAGGL